MFFINQEGLTGSFSGTTCGFAATCGHSLGAATCGHLRPLAWSGHLQPLAATRVAASGCEWLRAGRNTWQSWHLEKIGFAGKAFFSSLEVG